MSFWCTSRCVRKINKNKENVNIQCRHCEGCHGKQAMIVVFEIVWNMKCQVQGQFWLEESKVYSDFMKEDDTGNMAKRRLVKGTTCVFVPKQWRKRKAAKSSVEEDLTAQRRPKATHCSTFELQLRGRLRRTAVCGWWWWWWWWWSKRRQLPDYNSAQLCGCSKWVRCAINIHKHRSQTSNSDFKLMI